MDNYTHRNVGVFYITDTEVLKSQKTQKSEKVKILEVNIMAEETTKTVETTAETNTTPTVDELMAQLAAERARADKNKLELDKALKENGTVKKALREKQTAEEAEAEARAEQQRIRDEEYEALKAENNLIKASNAYKGISDEKVVAKLIDAVSSADHTAIAKLIDEQCRKAVADAEANWLANRPRVNNGSGDGTPLSKKDIMAIRDFGERQRAIAENMNLFQGGN